MQKSFLGNQEMQKNKSHLLQQIQYVTKASPPNQQNSLLFAKYGKIFFLSKIPNP